MHLLGVAERASTGIVGEAECVHIYCVGSLVLLSGTVTSRCMPCGVLVAGPRAIGLLYVSPIAVLSGETQPALGLGSFVFTAAADVFTSAADNFSSAAAGALSCD